MEQNYQGGLLKVGIDHISVQWCGEKISVVSCSTLSVCNVYSVEINGRKCIKKGMKKNESILFYKLYNRLCMIKLHICHCGLLKVNHKTNPVSTGNSGLLPMVLGNCSTHTVPEGKSLA